MNNSSPSYNSIFGANGQPQPEASVFVSYGAGAYIDASGMENVTILALGAGDYITLDADEDGAPGSQGDGNTIFAVGNNDSIALGSSHDNNIYLLGKNGTVEGSSFPGSSDTVHVEGAVAHIILGGDDNTVLLDSTGANVTVLATQVADSEVPFGGTKVTASGTGSATVTGAGDSFAFTGASGHYDIDGGTAVHSTISGGSGGGTFTGGYFESAYPVGYGDGKGGVDYRYLYDGNDTVTAGTQSSTVTGGAHGSSMLIAAGSARDLLIAGEYGNDTLSGGTSTGNNTYEGFTGIYRATDDLTAASVVIQAGKGNDTLIGGYAPETMTGGAGSDVFRFVQINNPYFNSDTLITDFKHGTDKIDLDGFAETTRQVIASETHSGGSTHFTLTDGYSVTLAHVASLTTSDFTHS